MVNAHKPANVGTTAISLRHCRELEDTGLVTAIFSEGMHIWRSACDPDASTTDREESKSNITQISKQLAISSEQLVFSIQTHTNTVRVIVREQAGEGATKPHTTGPHDALVTNEPGIMLCTLEADCLPIYLLDPRHHAIGMVHSGWRGTAQTIGPITLETMATEFGTQPSDVLAYFGPSICGSCYEVGAELRDEFAQNFSQDEMEQFFVPLVQAEPVSPESKENETAHLFANTAADACSAEAVNRTKESVSDKYLLDNAKAARISLLRAGILAEKIFTCNICTFENEKFASYRRTGAVKERMLTAIMLR